MMSISILMKLILVYGGTVFNRFGRGSPPLFSFRLP